MDIAVTGATGHLGGGVVEELLRRGLSSQQVIPLVRDATKSAQFEVRGMKPRVADYQSRRSMKEALAGVDSFVVISPPNMDSGTRVLLIQNAVLAAYDAGVAHLVYIGLAAPEKQAFHLEDVELATEYLIKALGIPYTFLRNTVYFDELRAELDVAAKTGELVSATDNRPLNWALRRDMATAIARAASEDGHLFKTYELTASRTFTYDDLAAALSKAIGRPIHHKLSAPESVIKTLHAGGMDSEHARQMVEIFHSAIAKDKFTDQVDTLGKFTGNTANLESSIRMLLD